MAPQGGAALSNLDALHARFAQKIVQRRDLCSGTAPRAVGENNALLGTGKSDKEPRRRLDLIAGKAPPCAIVQTDEDDAVIFEPFALVDRHQRNSMNALPHDAPWLEDYVKELTGFPGTKFDDQVDSTAQALDYMRKNDTLAVWRRLGQL